MNSPSTNQHRSAQASFARAGLFSLLGAGVSASLGFALSLLLARSLGDRGYGAMLQAIAIFSIALSFGRLGMDSAALWVCARSQSFTRQRLRSAVRMMLRWTALGSAAAAAVVCGVGWILRSSSNADARDVGTSLLASGWALPFAGVLLVVLSASRGLGAIKPYVLVGNVGLPVSRIGGAAVAAWAGWQVAGQSFVWAAATVLLVVVAVLVFRVQLQGARSADVSGSDEAGSRGEISRYAVGRTISAVLEQGLLHLDVVLVGILAGSAAAGVYGGAIRFVAAGLIADVAIRAVVAPRFGTLIQRRKFGELQALYRISAVWLVLLSAPVYLALAFFAPAVLAWLGPEFVTGSSVLVILSMGTMVTLAAGNIHSILLMGGRSGLAAANKAAALGTNVVANLILIPRVGIVGAAWAWTAAMLLDAALATAEVRRYVGISPPIRAVLYPLVIAGVTFGVPAVMARALWGPTTGAMLAAIGLALGPYVAWCIIDRDRLGLSNLTEALRRQPIEAPPA
jgi:O-antigen/teichoic acid export membrane protein